MLAPVKCSARAESSSQGIQKISTSISHCAQISREGSTWMMKSVPADVRKTPLRLQFWLQHCSHAKLYAAWTLWTNPIKAISHYLFPQKECGHYALPTNVLALIRHWGRTLSGHSHSGQPTSLAVYESHFQNHRWKMHYKILLLQPQGPQWLISSHHLQKPICRALPSQLAVQTLCSSPLLIKSNTFW